MLRGESSDGYGFRRWHVECTDLSPSTMAHTRPIDDLSPEEAVREITQDRKRRSMIALALSLLGVVVFATLIVLAFNDVPAPQAPANANPPVQTPR